MAWKGIRLHLPNSLGGLRLTDNAIEILLIDDDPVDQLLARRLIDAANIHALLTVVDDGEAAIRNVEFWSKSDRPDLVLLDLGLPKRSGHVVLEHIKKKDPNIPVVMFTGSSSQDDSERARQLGASDYIVKPIGAKEFGATISRLRRLVELLKGS